MKIVSWNVNGIRACERHGLSVWLRKVDADIVCLQEIKADANQIPDEINQLPYYKYVNPAKKKGYAGTLILTKSEAEKVEYGLGDKQFDDEGRIITIHYEGLTIVNVYMPHGARDKSKLAYKLQCCSKLKSYLKTLVGERVLVVGDFNIAHTELDLARPKQNTNSIMFTDEERQEISSLESLGYGDVFRTLNPNARAYTWFPYAFNARERDLGWRIDYGFASRSLVKDVYSCQIDKTVHGSDHVPITIIL